MCSARRHPTKVLRIMSMPREIIPESFYLLTRRCALRQFFLRPDDDLNNAFLYCLAEASKRFRIDIVMATVLSNHHHITLYDHYGNVSAFMEHLHRMCAKCINVLRG